MDFLSPILTGLLLFVATNIDEYFLGLLFIVQPGITKRDMWIGKFIALFVIFGISLLFVFIIHSFSIPIELIGILGFLPLYIGMKALKEKDKDELEESKEKIDQFSGKAAWVVVSLVHIASGGDNIGIYVPAFATVSLNEITIIAIIFILLNSLWVVSPYWVIGNERIKKSLEKWGERLFPWLMILLAISIFWETGIISYLFTSLNTLINSRITF